MVYESIYGNTRQVAEAVAEGLGGAKVVSVPAAGATVEDVDLVVVGGPTHMHGMATSLSRRMAVEAAKEDGHAAVQPGPADGPGLRRWLHDLPARDGAPAAAFDTRIDKSPTVTGMAARGIARRLRRRGYEILGTESFLVERGTITRPLYRRALSQPREGASDTRTVVLDQRSSPSLLSQPLLFALNSSSVLVLG